MFEHNKITSNFYSPFIFSDSLKHEIIKCSMFERKVDSYVPCYREQVPLYNQDINFFKRVLKEIKVDERDELRPLNFGAIIVKNNVSSKNKSNMVFINMAINKLPARVIMDFINNRNNRNLAIDNFDEVIEGKTVFIQIN